ncbi:MAG: mechanosensitive ion channel family protein [Mycobacteriales bacterium]
MGWEATRAAVATGGALLAAVAVGTVIHVVIRGLARRDPLLSVLSARCRRPFRALLVVVALLLARPERGADDATVDVVRHALTLLLIAVGAWLFAQSAFVIEDAALRRYDISVADNLRARRLRTQVIVVRRVTVVLTFFTAVAAMLMTFRSVRTIGASLLASAGILGIVAGLAAQTTLSNVFAGLQLAFTDHLRIDDAVVVEGEWGRIEELTLTYVVVHLWDDRRLVLPTTYFTAKPFQNWTRNESRVIGTVELHVDFQLAVEPVRRELERVLAASPLWDQRDWALQVTETTPTTMVLRAMMGAPDAPGAWDLRCEVREKLIAFVCEHHPDALPRVRTDVVALPDAGSPTFARHRRRSGP